MRPGGIPTLGRLLDFFLPPACLGCGGRIPLERAEALVCQACLTRLRPLPSPSCPRCSHPLGTARSPGRPCSECHGWSPVLRGARSAVVLEGPAHALVHALKYDGWRGLSAPMASLMSRVLPRGPQGPGEPVLVPVPTTAARARRRGYNQAAALAQALSASTGVPCLEALIRVGPGRTQVSLHPHERRANVEGAFQPLPRVSERLRGRRVLLVDDVLTTGATGEAAARALERAGASDVWLVTFARAVPHRLS